MKSKKYLLGKLKSHSHVDVSSVARNMISDFQLTWKQVTDSMQ